jgi:hypothetical protein
MQTNIHFYHISLTFLEEEIFLTKVVEKIKTHISYLINFSKIVLFVR